MLQALIVLAQAEAEEPSKTPFYILGGLLAVWAVVVAAVGITQHSAFPPSKGAARGVMALSALLVFATMAAAVLTS